MSTGNKRLTFKKTSAGVQAYSELHLRDFIRQIPVQQTTSSVSAEIEQITQSRVKVMGELLDEIYVSSENFEKLSNFIEDVDAGKYDAFSKGPRRSTAAVRDAFQRAKEAIVDMTRVGTKELSHTGVTNVSMHLYAFYVQLRAFGQGFDWAGKQQVDIPRKGTGLYEQVFDDKDRYMGTFERQTKGRTMTQSQYNGLVEDIRRLYIISKAIAEMPADQFTGASFHDMRIALDRYFRKGQDHHFIGKEQTTNVAAGIADAELTFEEQGDRSDLEYILGHEKMNILLGQQRQGIIQNIYNHFGDKWDQIVGSPSIKEDVIKGLSEQLVTGKKPKTRKHKSKYENKQKRKPDARAKKVQTDIGKTITKAALAAAAMKKVRTPAKGEAPGQKPKRGADESQLSPKELGYLKRKINTRLPQQVAENMGRPALNFQTGRFANSTRLVDLKQGEKNLIGKYTYMLNPYETFENTGRYRWPTGYNPKPLIAQSIRELAEQYTNKKFTLRRQ